MAKKYMVSIFMEIEVEEEAFMPWEVQGGVLVCGGGASPMWTLIPIGGFQGVDENVDNGPFPVITEIDKNSTEVFSGVRMFPSCTSITPIED